MGYATVMLQWALNWLERRGRKLVIMDRDDEEEYLQRWYLWYPDSVDRERKDIPFNVMIHRFMQSDVPVFHSHPWDWYRTIILKGGYWAHTPWGVRWCGPGHTEYVDCEREKRLYITEGPWLPANLHWVEVPKPGETWTLFIRGRTTHKWGFVPRPETGEWIPWQKYLSDSRKAMA